MASEIRQRPEAHIEGLADIPLYISGSVIRQPLVGWDLPIINSRIGPLPKHGEQKGQVGDCRMGLVPAQTNLPDVMAKRVVNNFFPFSRRYLYKQRVEQPASSSLAEIYERIHLLCLGLMKEVPG